MRKQISALTIDVRKVSGNQQLLLVSTTDLFSLLLFASFTAGTLTALA
jgi:hypothetical protein